VAGFFIRQDWTTKPPFGTPLRRDGHWSVQGLVGAWAFNEGSGSKVYDAQGLFSGDFTPGSFSQNGAELNGFSSYLDFPSLTQSLTKLSIITSLRVYDTGSKKNIISKDSPASRGWVFRVDQAMQICFESNGAIVDYGSVIPIGIDTCVALSHDGLVGTGYKDGLPVFSTSTTLNTNSAAVEIGRRNYPGYEEYFCGNIRYLYLFSRPLSSIEIASLYANPWQIFELKTVWLSVGSTGSMYTSKILNDLLLNILLSRRNKSLR